MTFRGIQHRFFQEKIGEKMIKEDTYKIKFGKLEPWIPEIFQAIRKELRNEHLHKNPSFVQKHFPKRPIDKLTIGELSAAYLKEIVEGDEDLGEKITARWVLKNAELYQFFVAELSKVNPKYDEIEMLSADVSSFLLNTAVSQFGARIVYIFSILNAVVFTQEQLAKLRDLALSDVPLREEKNDFVSAESVKEHYEREMRKLTEKYEKRIQGIERKYFQDVEGLKKQIAQLHKKLQERAVGVGV